MSMYDAVLGDGKQHERGIILRSILLLPVVPRYRDAWVEKGEDGPVIAIYTRQGGGNRECYCGEDRSRHVPASCYATCNEELAAHPQYLRDADDRYDSTYATFYFRTPDDFRNVLELVAGEPVDMAKRWEEAAARLDRGELRPAERALADQVGAFLTDPEPGDGPRIMEI